MSDISTTAAFASAQNTFQYGMIADLQTTSSILSNASPTAGSAAAGRTRQPAIRSPFPPKAGNCSRRCRPRS